MNGENGQDRAARELELPYRLVGYNPTTDDNGDIVLLVSRSRLELAPVVVHASPHILKQIVGQYIAAEGAAAAPARVVA